MSNKAHVIYLGGTPAETPAVEGHNRLHSILSHLDHEVVPVNDRQKFLTSDANGYLVWGTYTDKYVSGVAFNPSTRVLTLARTGGLSNLQVEIPPGSATITEQDPVFMQSPASGITAYDIECWDAAYEMAHGHVSYLLEWHNLLFRPYTAKISPDPGFPYFYNNGTTDGDTTYQNILKLDGRFFASSVQVQTSIANYLNLAGTTGVRHVSEIYYVGSFLSTNSSLSIEARNYASGRSHPIRIGASAGWGNQEHLLLDDYNSFLDVAFTNIRFPKGTAERYFYLDENNILTFRQILDTEDFWSRNGDLTYIYPKMAGDLVGIRSENPLGTFTIGENAHSESIVFGLLKDAELNTYIRWQTNGESNFEIGLTGSGVNQKAKVYSGADNLEFTGKYVVENYDTVSSTAYTIVQSREYDGVVDHIVRNSGDILSERVRANFSVSVHPGGNDYSTFSFTLTGKNYGGAYAGEPPTLQWGDSGTGYLKHSANIVTGGNMKPALNIGTRSNKPIRFFLGSGINELNFDNSTLKMVLWPSGKISIGGHDSIAALEAAYTLDILSGDVRILNGHLYFAGGIGQANATGDLYLDALTDLQTGNVFRAKGYKSSDGSAGMTGSATFDPRMTKTITVTIKNGLITAITQEEIPP